jgi:hypothetical protein
MKCVALDCVNDSSEGRFVGELCAPCDAALKLGAGIHGTSILFTQKARVTALEVQVAEARRLLMLGEDTMPSTVKAWLRGTSETALTHSTECLFQHFLSYSGFGLLYQNLGRSLNDLRVAYYSGADVDVTSVTDFSCPACENLSNLKGTDLRGNPVDFSKVAPEDAAESLSKYECGMGCGRKFATTEVLGHHEELCEGPALKSGATDV